MRKNWTEDEIEFMSVALKEGWTHKEIANELDRTSDSTKHKSSRLNLISLNNKVKTQNEYVNQLPKDIILLDIYINVYTKIKHKHKTCGHIWKAIPRNILGGKGCPNCANSNFKDKIPATTYLIYFPEHDLYKFGISNNYKQRFKNFGSKPEIIFILDFNTGLEARELERQWSKNVDYLKINTGLLKSGNTETFRY